MDGYNFIMRKFRETMTTIYQQNFSLLRHER